MSRIDDLISRLAPGGVPFKTLGEVLRIRNGKDHKTLGDGDIPVYGSGGIMRYADTAAAEGPSVLIPRKGSLGNIFYVEGPFWVVDTIFRTEIQADLLEPKFLYHQLLTMGLGDMNQAGGVPSQTQTVLNSLRIPVPPLEVQREIVRILDQFTQLEAELEAELEARRVQYAHYRDTQLSFPQSTPRVLLGDVGSIFGGLTGKAKADFANGNARFVSYVNVFNNIAVNTRAEDFVHVGPHEKQRSLQRGDIIFTGSSETPDEVGMSSVVTTDVSEPLYLNSFCIGFRPTDNDLIDPDFAKHLFRSGEMRGQIVRTASGVTRFNVSKARLAKVELPVPPKEEQRRLAHLLDNFEALVNNLSVGLPAELRARRQQYEYYRDKLLTFEELSA